MLADDDFGVTLSKKAHAGAVPGRGMINSIALLLALFVPWGVFSGVFAAMSFRMHYENPGGSMGVCVGALFLALAVAMKGQSNARKGTDYLWHYYNAAAILLAASVAGLAGDLNFWFHMQPYYDVRYLATYVNVNPSTTTYPDGRVVPQAGRRFQDAGKVYFQPGSHVDKFKAQSFKSHDTYCVAPIVASTCEKNCGYDFWAVGLNCCGEESIDFRCGMFADPRARAGMRMVRDDQRPFYRLAVLEAEGTHKISAPHPLFFYWLEDPVGENHSYAQNGYSNFLKGILFHFFFNLGCVCFVVYWIWGKIN